DSNVVGRHIYRLRAKLQSDWRRPRTIVTVPGRGYRFIPEFLQIKRAPARPTVGTRSSVAKASERRPVESARSAATDARHSKPASPPRLPIPIATFAPVAAAPSWREAEGA
ncbi:MAG TPA: winged helix-turn-helix domain-containing protein, partial [Chloroflexota bacterium]|nr:winged helix-turn-helix domain-containing protein [Chloroflexota bacterium]